MHIAEDELKKIAGLACIKIDFENTTQLANDVVAIMNFIEEMRLIDTKDTEPLLHPLDLHQRLRTDEVSEENQVPNLANIAPHFADDHYLVPKVIDIGK